MSNDPSPPESETEDERDDATRDEHDTPSDETGTPSDELDTPEDEPDATSDESDTSIDARQEATDIPSDAPDPTPNSSGTTPDSDNSTPETPNSASDASEPISDTPGSTPNAPDSAPNTTDSASETTDSMPELPPDVQKYARFKKMDGAQYERVNEFLRDRTYITAREWAIARLCADFRTETGVEMTKIGDNLPYLVPFMTDTYTPQAVNQARSAFEEKVRKAGATFLYGAMSGFFTAEELDDVMYEVTEVAKFLLEVEGVDLSVDEELAAEDRISNVMREVRESSEQLRHDEMECPHCGREIGDEE